MLTRLRDLLTGLLVAAVAFGLVDRALRRPVSAGVPADDATPEPTDDAAPEPTADPGPAPDPTPDPEQIEQRLSERGSASVEVVSTGSGIAMALLGAAPIVVAIVAFAGREGVPLASRLLVGLAVLALATAAGVLLVVRPIASRHAALIVAAISIEMVAVMAAIAIDSAS